MTDVTLEVWEEIKKSYSAHNWRLFWPSHFIQRGIGNERQVLKALDCLHKKERLKEEKYFQCYEGHRITKTEEKPKQCPACFREGESVNDFDFFVRYILTSEGEDKLGGGKRRFDVVFTVDQRKRPILLKTTD